MGIYLRGEATSIIVRDSLEISAPSVVNYIRVKRHNQGIG